MPPSHELLRGGRLGRRKSAWACQFNPAIRLSRGAALKGVIMSGSLATFRRSRQDADPGIVGPERRAWQSFSFMPAARAAQALPKGGTIANNGSQQAEHRQIKYGFQRPRHNLVARSNTFLTVDAYHVVPRAVRTLRLFKCCARATNDVNPARLSSSMTGKTDSANFSA